MITFPDIVLASIPKINHISNEITNQSSSTELLDDDSKLLPGNYTPDQINDIIYHLYQIIQNSNSTENGYGHDLPILIDLVCSDELYESAVEACDIITELPSAVEACDIITELPIESNNY